MRSRHSIYRMETPRNRRSVESLLLLRLSCNDNLQILSEQVRTLGSCPDPTHFHICPPYVHICPKHQDSRYLAGNLLNHPERTFKSFIFFLLIVLVFKGKPSSKNFF